MTQKRRKHVPLRTCVVCRQKLPKRELIRIVRTLEGTIEIDPRGKHPGRGAYLCHKRRCWETALERGTLARALKSPLDVDTARVLLASAQDLLAEEAASET